MHWYDNAVTSLENDLAAGNITDAEFQAEMRALNDEMRGAAEDAAEQAYNDTMGTRRLVISAEQGPMTMKARTTDQAIAAQTAHNLEVELNGVRPTSSAAASCISAAIAILRDHVMHPEDRHVFNGH